MREYIFDTIGQYIELQGDGDRLTARCPFHHEETPSFVVDQKKLSFRCFGCGANGHVEDFKGDFDRHRSTQRA
jgi:DNA primase